MKKITNIEIFKPLLREFCEQTKRIDIDPDFPSIFLPHTMNNYDLAKKKIFYFGRDTYGHTATKDLMEKYDSDNIEEYIQEMSEWINEYGFLEYNNNLAYGFWTLAMKLHLRLKGIIEDVSISPNMPSHLQPMIDDFGWGNTNAIEVQKTLQKRGLWEALDKEKYWKVKEASKKFDKLEYTLRLFDPDIVFIFNWETDENIFLEGLNYDIEKFDDLVNGHFWIITLKDYKTKIVWTVHPNNLMFQGLNIDNLIDIIEKKLRSKNIL